MAQKHTLDYKEYPMTRDGRIQGPSRRYRRLRHPSFAADLWTAKNPLLQRGEIGVEIDTNKIKAGDGITYWNDLPYVTSVGQPLSTANYQMGNSSGGWTTMSQTQQDALNSGATTTNISQIATNTSAIAGKVSIDGSSTMTGVLKMRASISFKCAIAPYWRGVGLYQLNDDDSVTLLASMETPDGWCPGTNDTFNMGSTSKKWKNLYLSGTAYIGAINNGFNITVPVTNSADEFALKSQVDLKANSADLGTAAYTASTDYATAAQGALADTAVQPGDLATVATTGKFSDLQNKPTTLSGYGITDGANTDLSNLTSTGANIGNWSHNVTNCITEIPQDIKLELNNGTLTLKAGSKVYVPNGQGVFNVVTIQNDIVFSGNSRDKYFVFVKNQTTSDSMPIDFCFSGSTAPTVTTTYAIWYDTANNKIKWTGNNGATWTEGYSFPICICLNNTPGTVNISSIDQVFNGLGYIGSTVFALPGVKGLIPNGRNADGTLNNTAVDFASVATYTFPNAETGNCLPVAIFNTGITYYGSTYTFFGGSRPSTTTNWTRWYNEKDNVWELYNNGWGVEIGCVIGFANVSSGVVQSLNVKSTFNSLDRGDIEFILQQSFPSNTYVDVTPGANGTIYTFGANGLLCIGFQHPDDSNWVNYGVDILDANENFIWNIQGTRMLNNQTDGVAVPVNKNQKVRIYNNSYVINRLRFVYAVGEV